MNLWRRRQQTTAVFANRIACQYFPGCCSCSCRMHIDWRVQVRTLTHTHSQTNWFLWSGPKNAVSLIKRHNNLRVRAIGASMIIDYVRWPVRQLIATSPLTMWCVNTRATNNVSLAAAHANCANNDNEKAL